MYTQNVLLTFFLGCAPFSFGMDCGYEPITMLWEMFHVAAATHHRGRAPRNELTDHATHVLGERPGHDEDTWQISLAVEDSSLQALIQTIESNGHDMPCVTLNETDSVRLGECLDGVRLEHFQRVGSPYFWGIDSYGRSFIAIMFGVTWEELVINDHCLSLEEPYCMPILENVAKKEAKRIVVFIQRDSDGQTGWMMKGNGQDFFPGAVEDNFRRITELICDGRTVAAKRTLWLSELSTNNETNETKKEK